MPISEQVLRDLREVARATRQDPELAATAEEQLVFRVLPALLDEVESLRDVTLQKDFLALYQAARGVTSALQTSAPTSDVEWLALQVKRLAPLYDDVRRDLNVRLAHRAMPVPLPDMGPLPFVLQGAVPARTGAALRPGQDTDPSLLDDLRLPSLLPDGVLHATPEQLADVIEQQLAEHEGRGIINREALDRTIASGRIEGAGTDEVRVTFQVPPMHEAFVDPGVPEQQFAADDELTVSFPLGPSLLPRVEALVATGRLGNHLQNVAQTLFVLGMLEAEGQDPSSHVGEPMLHCSAEALFVRFGLPHEGDDPAAQQRAAILRRLFLDLTEWCDEADPLRPAFAAAISALPR